MRARRPPALRDQLRWRWQFQVRRRLVRFPILRRLPWRVWLFLCAWDAPSVIAEFGRRREAALRFVQIGSHDGHTNDPLAETIRARGWCGLLVEPLPHLYSRLLANYRGIPGLRFENVAIADITGEVTMYVVEPRPGDPGWVDQLASLDPEVLRRHSYALPELESRIQAVTVPALRLSELVARHNIDAVDVLHVDAEGYDAEIVDQIPPNASWAPTCIVFERKHLSQDRLAATKERLRAAGYTLVNIWPDELAFRSGPGRWHDGPASLG